MSKAGGSRAVSRVTKWAAAFSVGAGLLACGSAGDGESIGSAALASQHFVPAYGVHIGPLGGGCAGLDLEACFTAQLDAAAANHVRMIRISIGSGQADDHFMTEAARRHITILPVLGINPKGGPNNNGYVHATDAGVWEKYVFDMAVRYGPIGYTIDAGGRVVPTGTLWRELATNGSGVAPAPVRAWEIWNEPDLDIFWYPQPNPAEYLNALRVAKKTLRAVDPRARVVFGGLSYVGDFVKRCMDKRKEHSSEARAKCAFEFVARVIEEKGSVKKDRTCLFDALAIHPYGNTARESFELVEATRQLLVDEGLGSRDLWLTEVGWAIGDQSWQYTVPTETGVVHRIDGLSQKLEENRKQWRIGPTLWYAFYDFKIAGEDAWPAHAGFFGMNPDTGGLALDPNNPPHRFLNKRRTWDKIGRIAEKHPAAELPQIHLCSWERASSNSPAPPGGSEEQCGCMVTCNQGDFFVMGTPVDWPTACAQAPQTICADSGGVKGSGYVYRPCG